MVIASLQSRLGRWAWGEGRQARSLGNVLPALAVIVMAILLVLLGLVMANATRESAQNEQGNTLEAQAKTFAGLLDQSISRELADLESRAASLASLKLHQDPNKLSIWIDGIRQKIPEYTWIGVADQQGEVQASTEGVLSGHSVAERDWFRQGLRSPTAVDLHEAKLLEPFLPARSDGPWRFIDLAAPLHDAKGNPIGVIGGHLSWDWLMSLKQNFSSLLLLPQGAEVLVAGSDGELRLAGPNASNLGLSTLESFQKAKSGESGWIREPWPDGQDYLVGFAPNPGLGKGHYLGWVTLIRAPVQGLDHASTQAVGGIWILVGSAIALFAVALRIVLRATLAPVNALVAQVGDVAQHGGRVDLSSPNPKEFRALGEATNQMIRAIEASQSADIAKSKFLADMSHEVRTLLHGMLSRLELMRLSQDAHEKAHDLEQALENGKQLVALVNDILDLSAIEEGKIRLERLPVRIAELARSNAGLYEALATSKGLEFELALDLADNTVIMADPLRLGQVLRNLIANAVKFTEQGSVKITVSCRTADGENKLCISVRDTGIGLTQAQQELIFGRFEQAGPGPSMRFGGSGLGLSLARALVEAMQGKMQLHSRIGQGSEFVVLLPIEDANEPASEYANAKRAPVDAPAAPTDPRKLCVLCVDDLKENRTVLCRWLALQGHDAHEACTAREALQKTQQQAFDVILMDIDLPDMQGTQAIAAIRNSGGPSSCAAIYTVSGHAYDTDITRSLASGSNGHISKPIDYALLREKLSQIATSSV